MDYGTLEETILGIGDDLALVQGGRCYEYIMNGNEKKIIYNCKRQEEEFSIVISFREVESIWYIPGRILFKHAKEREMKTNV